jgi:hypothetical protein
MKKHWSAICFSGLAILLFSSLALAGSPVSSPAPTTAGRLALSFLYNAPTTELEPSYHTAIWLADKDGHYLKTLYVSDELSHVVYKFDYACPDWVKQSGWAKAEKSVVDAVSKPTPDVGDNSMAFDLDQLRIKPGTYQIWFQVNLSEKYNVLFRGTFVAGGAKRQEITYETLFSPKNVPPGGEDLVKVVMMEYQPAEAK